MKHDLLNTSYGDVKGEKYGMAVLPWGATEPHNYHLPYITDAILSHDVSVDAALIASASGAEAMVLPPVFYGSQNPGQRELPFCIHGSYGTQKAILTDIITSLEYQGMHKLLIVNGHGGNSFKNMIRDVNAEFPDFLIGVCDWFSMAPRYDFFEMSGEHADELETSAMLHYHPELVDMSAAGPGTFHAPKLRALAEGKVWMPRRWNEVSDDTGIGDPGKSTPEKGKAYAEAVASILAQVICDMVQVEITAGDSSF